MRASSHQHPRGANRRRALLSRRSWSPPSASSAAALVGGAPAATPQEELRQTRDKLEGVRESQSELAATIAEQNRRSTR